MDFLDQRSRSGKANWQEVSPAVSNFATCPCVIVRPRYLHDTQRVSISESPAGRFVTIKQRTGEKTYLLQVVKSDITLNQIETLIDEVEAHGGECSVEGAFFVIQLPAGYELNFTGRDLTGINILADQQTGNGESQPAI